jgi:hypothetical protein
MPVGLLSLLWTYVFPHAVLRGEYARQIITPWRPKITQSNENQRFVHSYAVLYRSNAYAVVSPTLDVFLLTEGTEEGKATLHNVFWRDTSVEKFSRFKSMRQWHGDTLNYTVHSSGNLLDLRDYAVWLSLSDMNG